MSQIATLLQELLKEIKKKPAVSELHVSFQLWTIEQVAEYLGLSVEYTQKNVITQIHFPPVRQIPTAKSNDRNAKRWRASDIIEWAMSIDKTTFDPSKPMITRSSPTTKA